MGLVFGFPRETEAKKKPVVAVFKIENKGTALKPQAVERLTIYLASKVGAAYEVVPQDKLKQALTAKKKSYRQCYQHSCEIEIGQDLGADKATATQVMKVGTTCVVTTILYDLKKATAEKAATAQGKCSEDAIAASIELVVIRLGAPPRTSASGEDLRGRPSREHFNSSDDCHRLGVAAVRAACSSCITRRGRFWREGAASKCIITPDPPDDVSKQLSPDEIRTGIGKIMPNIVSCHDRYKVDGLAKMTFVIAPTGTVTQATIQGQLSGTDTGSCIIDAVKRARFRTFKGKAMTIIRYPFLLQ